VHRLSIEIPCHRAVSVTFHPSATTLLNHKTTFQTQINQSNKNRIINKELKGTLCADEETISLLYYLIALSINNSMIIENVPKQLQFYRTE
jgi:hypothetical protein